MTGHTISSLKTNVLDDIEDITGESTKLDQNNSFMLFGNTMRCFGTDKAHSYKAIKGFTSHGHYANEVPLSHKDSVLEVIARCSGEGARFFWDGNPHAPNHYIYTDYIKRNGLKTSKGRLFVNAQHYRLEDNAAYLPDGYIENLKEITPAGVKFDRDILGLWVAAEGVCFNNWIESQMLVDDIPPFKEYIAGVDWGYRHHGVIEVFGLDHENRAFLIEEIAAQEKQIEWWVARRNDLVKKYKGITFYCGTDRPEYIRKFRGREANTVPNSVSPSISFVNNMMEKGQFFVWSKAGAVLWLEQTPQYVWKDNSTKEEPVKDNDDAPDATRYALFTRLSKLRARARDIKVKSRLETDQIMEGF